jgi:hypothetical protein
VRADATAIFTGMRSYTNNRRMTMTEESKKGAAAVEPLTTIEKLDDLKKSNDAVLDALKELTKVVGALKSEQELLRKSGRF